MGVGLQTIGAEGHIGGPAGTQNARPQPPKPPGGYP
jgi:hypothetical protein